MAELELPPLRAFRKCDGTFQCRNFGQLPLWDRRDQNFLELLDGYLPDLPFRELFRDRVALLLFLMLQNLLDGITKLPAPK